MITSRQLEVRLRGPSASLLLGLAALVYWPGLGRVVPDLALDAGYQATCYGEPPRLDLGWRFSPQDLESHRRPYPIELWGEWMTERRLSLFRLAPGQVMELRGDQVVDLERAASPWLALVANGPWILLLAAALLLPAWRAPARSARSELLIGGVMGSLTLFPAAVLAEYARTHPWLFQLEPLPTRALQVHGTAALGIIVMLVALRLRARAAEVSPAPPPRSRRGAGSAA